MNTWHWYIYIIECLDGTYYTGLTWDVRRRLEQHLSRLGGRYTAEHGVKRLVYVEQHSDFQTARGRERQIKDWSRVKKEKLINGDWMQR